MSDTTNGTAAETTRPAMTVPEMVLHAVKANLAAVNAVTESTATLVAILEALHDPGDRQEAALPNRARHRGPPAIDYFGNVRDSQKSPGGTTHG